ncbi:hypothetical protein [Candidatus Tisiphia endosymbiont of Ptychoptera albimana]|uniref:hypothetical protein n=1 Tax=Candidatus Tisiphia endosymbiont of Ptychoptera albimana TaxID=3066260 RepID=UPI00312CA4C5
MSKPQSTEEQNVNLPLEVTTKRGEKTLSEIESTEEQSVNLPTEVTVSSANEASPCNSSDASPTDDESDYDSDSDSDSDSTDGYSGGNGSEQEASGKLPRWLSDIAKQAKV